MRWLANTPVPESTRPGSITVAVSDIGGAGGVLSGALVSVYRAPAGTTATRFNAKTWEASEAAYLQTGRTDTAGKVTFGGLEPGLYVVNYEHYPETRRNAWRWGPAATAGVLPPGSGSHPQTTFKNANCQDIPVRSRESATACIPRCPSTSPMRWPRS